MAKLNDYPNYFNDVELFRAEKWSYKRGKVKKTNQSEAGTDLVNLIRTDKATISAKFLCTDEWLRIFENFDDMDSFILRTYDAQTNGYISKRVRLDNFSADLNVYSGATTRTIGAWEVTFDIVQF